MSISLEYDVWTYGKVHTNAWAWAELAEEYREQRVDVLLGNAIVLNSRTGQTCLDRTKASYQPSEPFISVSDGSLCVQDATSSCHDVKTKRRRTPNRKRLQQATGYLSTALLPTRILQHIRYSGNIQYPISLHGFDGWLDKRNNAFTRFLNLMPYDNSSLRWFQDASQAKQRMTVDNEYRFQPRLDFLCARGQICRKSLAPLLICRTRMPQTNNRVIEIGESAVAVAVQFEQEKAYVVYTGDSTGKRHIPSVADFVLKILGIRSFNGHDHILIRRIKACFGVESVGRSTFATSKEESFSREAGLPRPGFDMLVRRFDTGLVSVDTSLFHDLIASFLMAPTAAFVITSWGMIEDVTLCTRDYSRWFPLDSDRAPTITELMLAAIIYSITTTVYSLRRHDESFQGEMLSVVLMLSAPGGLWLNCDLQTIVLCICPWAIIVALLLSSVFHSIAQTLSNSSLSGA